MEPVAPLALAGSDRASSAVFTADGRRVLVACPGRARACVWEFDASTGAALSCTHFSDVAVGVESAFLSPDARRVALVSVFDESTVRVHDLDTQALLCELECTDCDNTGTGAFSDDGSQFFFRVARRRNRVLQRANGRGLEAAQRA